MKKILSLVMALAMVTSLVAAPKVALPNKPAKQTRTELTLSAVQKQQPQVKHVAKKNVARKAVSRKVAMAGTTFTYSTSVDAQTKDGFTITLAQGAGQNAPKVVNNYETQVDEVRLYLGNTITVSGASITGVELTFTKQGTKDYATLSADAGNLASGGVSTSNDDPKTDVWTGTASSVTFELGTKGQRILTRIVVYGEGGDTPTPPTPPTPVGDYITPEQALEIGNALADNTTTVVEYRVVGIVSYANNYNTQYGSQTFSMSSDGADDKSNFKAYQCYLASPGVVVGDSVAVTGKILKYVSGSQTTIEIKQGTVEILGGDTPPTPVGDTIPLSTLDAFEFGYYGSYSEEGAYNYTLAVYNSQVEDYVPYVSFDIYTEVKDEFTGIFSVKNANLGLDYSAFFPTADSEGEYFTDATVTIKEGEGDDLIIEGIFTTEGGATYTFSVTAEPFIYDAEHPYEPQEAKTFNLTAVEGETDETYFADYGLVYYYLDMEDGSYVGLTYRTENGTQPKGTFAISDEEGVDAFLTGMDYYGYPDGSYYETVEGDVYYFVSGSVILATDEAGNTTITVNATSFYGSTFTVTGVIGGKQPSGDHTIVIADYAEVNFTTTDGAYTVASAQGEGTSAPAYNATSEDLRLYAKNTFTLTSNNAEMTEIVFNISDKGLARQADIAVSAGEITSYDMTNAKVTWKGNATEVIFTVGATNAHGSDGPTKAGQFDFTSIDIVIPTTGLLPVMMNDHIKTFMYEGKMFINANGSIYNMQGAKIR